jgi:outer membrane immunogenic protein
MQGRFMKAKIAAAAAIFIGSTIASSAADMAVKAPMVAPPPVWTWTGFYIGAHVGAGWGTTESTLTDAAIVAPGGALAAAFSFPFSQNSRSGFLGGVQAGYNWQSGWAVFGVQGDFAGADITGTNPCLLLLSCSSDTNWLATVSGRLGAVVLDRGLVYVKGGAAWMNTNHSVNLPGFGTLLGGGGGGLAAFSGAELASRESTAFGWLIGMGTEWQITPNWTAFVEYNYIRFDTKNESFLINPALIAAAGGAGTTITVGADLRNTMSIAKVGVNYKFNWGY